MLGEHLSKLRLCIQALRDAETGSSPFPPASRKAVLEDMLRVVDLAEDELLLLQGDPPELASLTFDQLAETLTATGWVEREESIYQPYGIADGRRGIKKAWTLDGHTITAAALEGHALRVTFDGDPVLNRGDLTAAIECSLPPLYGLDTIADLVQTQLDPRRQDSADHLAAQLRRHAVALGQRTAPA
ncbi:hypothetical protein [Amycolatopsis anabasis]|uniref:hypothetical protein n=1 Tax=Amycolatopsis anabasis TaxID=1840409 RepID=UPI00131B31BC|nr:hypothetical protein [Amycolatopsis anabasis]